MGLIIFLLGVFLMARLIRTAFGSGVKVTIIRRKMPDGSVVVDETEQVIATRTDKIVARVVLLGIFLFLAKLTWMLQLWSF